MLNENIFKKNSKEKINKKYFLALKFLIEFLIELFAFKN